MKNMRSTAAIIILISLITGCKVQKNIPSNKDDNKVDTLNIDSFKIDTLTVAASDTIIIQDTVEIAIHRLLKDTVAIIGVGDIMMGTNFPDERYLPPSDGRLLFQEVDSILQDADVTFGNLEGVVLNEGGKQKYCKNPKVCYLFRTPDHYIENLVNAGFDVVSTANNHAGDFGDEGRQNTMNVLDSAGIHHAGLLTKPYTTFMIDGMKYGFAAFAPNTGTSSINNIPRAVEIIQHLDSISDIVIVSFHGGAEGSKYQNVTRETETFYGENRGNVYEFSHTLVEAGADVIFGHGPHVTRAVEVYKDRFIAYSLGNFCTYARFNLRGDNGLAPIIKVLTNAKGEFIQAEVTPTIQYSPGGPRLDPQKRVIKKLQELTTKDFPEVPLNIDPTGIITYIKN